MGWGEVGWNEVGRAGPGMLQLATEARGTERSSSLVDPKTRRGAQRNVARGCSRQTRAPSMLAQTTKKKGRRIRAVIQVPHQISTTRYQYQASFVQYQYYRSTWSVFFRLVLFSIGSVRLYCCDETPPAFEEYRQTAVVVAAQAFTRAF